MRLPGPRPSNDGSVYMERRYGWQHSPHLGRGWMGWTHTQPLATACPRTSTIHPTSSPDRRRWVPVAYVDSGAAEKVFRHHVLSFLRKTRIDRGHRRAHHVSDQPLHRGGILRLDHHRVVDGEPAVPP